MCGETNEKQQFEQTFRTLSESKAFILSRFAEGKLAPSF